MSVLEERISGSSQNAQQVQVYASLCPKERLEIIAKYAQACRSVEGEFWEMGVYMGGSAGLIGRLAPEKVLRLFDSFEGISEPGDKDMPTVEVPLEGPQWAGEWRGDMRRALINIGRDCIVHKGWIPETFKEVPAASRCAFAHVDTDLYQPIKDSLEFILPRLNEGGFIVVDDFEGARNPGVKTAIEELLPEWPNLRGRVEVPAQVVLYLEE
jgi:O-methyltransferase